MRWFEGLSHAQVEGAQRALIDAEWVDGAETAQGSAKELKRNQMAMSVGDVELVVGMVGGALNVHPGFMAYARPNRVTQPQILRYRKGDYYGPHYDRPVMTLEAIRVDLSYTVFLNKPSEYEGGELVICPAPGVEHKVKGAAGEVFVYPTGYQHWVTPVTSGERLVAVGWVESRIRNPQQREVLSSLHRGIESDIQSELQFAYEQLERMWLDS